MSLFTEGKLFKKAGEGSGGGSGGDKHNLGWYATQAALEEAHPMATAGDWAIVGSTDTVWIWDTDTNAWKDSDQKGQVTSVNGQTGEVVLDLLPSQTGNAGKFLTTNGTDAGWGTTINGEYKNIVTFSGYVPIFKSVDNSNKEKFTISYKTTAYSGTIIFRDSDANYKVGLNFTNNGGTEKLIYPIGTGFSFGNPYAHLENIYTKKINNGADINIPTTGGTMAVIGVNTTVTLAVANWSSNTQTVNVTGMTATGVVLVSPDPTDQADYTSAGIICSAQAAGTLTFSCDSVPSGDIDVVVVML